MEERDTQAACCNQGGLLLAGAAGPTAFTPNLDLLSSLGLLVQPARLHAAARRPEGPAVAMATVQTACRFPIPL